MDTLKLYHKSIVSLGAEISIDGDPVDGIRALRLDFKAGSPTIMNSDSAVDILYRDPQPLVANIELIVTFEEE